MRDVRFGKPRAHKRDMRRRHGLYDYEQEATEYVPEDVRPIRYSP